jgi:hypothetical protein
MVASAGFFVAIDTTTINTDEITTIGTTGRKPQIAVPPGVRANRSRPNADHTTCGGPGAGAGTVH